MSDPAPTTAVMAARFDRTTLDSGVTVVTERMSEVRSVSVGFWFDVGSRDEPQALSGTSHFLEHLLFKGTEKRSAKDIADIFDAVGGDVNAFTSKEYTCYYARVVDNDLALALDVLTDMLTNSEVEPQELESERKVILEEIAMHEDAPDELVHDLFFRSMWDGHPLGRPVLGSNETVSAVSRDQVVDYWRERYNASNLVVAAAGNVEHQQVVDCVAELFGRRGSPTVRPSGKPQARFGVDVHRRPTEQAHVIFGKEGLPRGHEDRHALTVLDTVLGGGMSSRLFQEIREKRGLAYSVYSYRSLFADSGTFGIYAGTTPQNVNTVIDIIKDEIAAVLEGGITGAELERAKGHIKGSLVLASEDPGSRMNRVGKQQLTTGEILSIDELIERFDRLEMEDIRRVADAVLAPENARITVLGPFEQDDFGSHAA